MSDAQTTQKIKNKPAKETFYVVPEAAHNQLLKRAYTARGFTQSEAEAAAHQAAQATRHGIRTHNGIKALHLDDLFGSKVGGCQPAAEIEVMPSRFSATEMWNAHYKLGQPVAQAAINRCIELADTYGTGTVVVDNAFHYLWGGGYVMQAAEKGYIAYTNCTASLAEVVPFGGSTPTLGTNPHSWGLPTTQACGFPIVVDWATSTIAMGRVQQLAREGLPLPENAAVNAAGQPTRNPAEVAALLPFGAHKGYGLSLLNELFGAYIGGSLPTLRSLPKENLDKKGEKFGCNFIFQVTHPEAISAGPGHFACGRTQAENVQAVLEDILKGGNANCLLPGQLEAKAAARSKAAGGLLFSAAEIHELQNIAANLKEATDAWQLSNFKPAEHA